MVLLKLEDLSLQLENETLLQEISFEIEAGDSLVIIGESGAGKSILLKTLIGHIPKQAQVRGTLYYQKENLLNLSQKDWQRIRGKQLAYMVQNPMAMFNPFQTIRTHFLETIKSHEAWPKATCIEKAVSAMKSVGLGHPEKLLRSYPFELSGGMLQRIMLAILLCLEPKLLLLDEPTSALDRYNRNTVLSLLQTIRGQGTALITITHDYDFARALGGQGLVLYGGKIVEKRTLEKLFISPQHPYSQRLLLENPYERLVK